MHGLVNVSTFIDFEWPYASVELAHAIYWHRKPRFRSFGERADLTTGTAPESTLNRRHHSGLAGWITFVPAFVPALALFVFTADSSELTVPLLSLSSFPNLVTTMMTDTLLDDIKHSS
jgi:hypothetical protein